jgi:CubicO group peptidase (beta-lactamase class C family)
MSGPLIDGRCDERFVAVREAFEDNFRERGELGAAVAVTIDGEPVVDLWGGWMDPDRSDPWQRDTLVDVFSVGKALAALCVLMLVDRGQVDLDSPVSRYWPEFAVHGKDAITVRMLLSHRAGLPGLREPLPQSAIYDWDLMTKTLANERLWWVPDSKHGYHVHSFGFLVGELVRRVSGRDIGTFFRQELAEPLDADFHYGIGASEDRRTAQYTFGADPGRSGEDKAARELIEGDEQRRMMLERVYFNPPGISGIGTVNTREWRAAQIPSANAHATARAVARIYSALALGGEVDGVRLLGPGTLERAIAEASVGVDAILGRPSRFGLGFQLTQPERPLGPNPSSFGHFGAGGALGFADPDERLAFGHVINRSGPRWQNPRIQALVDAVYASL